MREVLKAVDEDSPGTSAEWGKLFVEDPATFNQSNFVEKVRAQMLDERMEFFDNLVRPRAQCPVPW